MCFVKNQTTTIGEFNFADCVVHKSYPGRPQDTLYFSRKRTGQHPDQQEE